MLLGMHRVAVAAETRNLHFPAEELRLEGLPGLLVRQKLPRVTVLFADKAACSHLHMAYALGAENVQDFAKRFGFVEDRKCSEFHVSFLLPVSSHFITEFRDIATKENMASERLGSIAFRLQDSESQP